MLVKPEIFVGLYVCACLFLQASVCWTHKSACTQYICSKYMSGCFICSKVPCSPLMKLLLYEHTHALICTPHTHKHRGLQSEAGLWEVKTHSWANGSQLGLINTHIHVHTYKPNHVLCMDSTLPGSVYLLYPLSLTPLSVLSFLSPASRVHIPFWRRYIPVHFWHNSMDPFSFLWLNFYTVCPVKTV